METINKYYAFEETKGKVIGEVYADSLEKAKKLAAMKYGSSVTAFSEEDAIALGIVFCPVRVNNRKYQLIVKYSNYADNGLGERTKVIKSCSHGKVLKTLSQFAGELTDTATPHLAHTIHSLEWKKGA